MKQLQTNEHFQVVKIEFAAGANMKRHIATSDAYLIVEDGNALLIYAGETYELSKGETFLIQANEEHMLKIINDFKAWIVLANGAQIKYFEPGNTYVN
ncbi:Cupin domain-containing protein [Mucilaginibacter gossypiicola]|uniref:Cupin domain-containing protein n=1 Tax=Mucilaginibacter gossypiicola TaxID=551995 RepID=A0A1H8HTM3_9SPHI|nr:cupin domain-containing protein [Mucilaginibacter gossypiicola]SEN59437.1 Cupin domain-containing protein [Mucilaginibacter gossypiicola]